MARVILVRHGETDYSLQNRYCGFSDPPLNDRGIWQAERLAYRMRNEKVDIVYSSDLKRAYETAKIVFKNKIVDKLANFREMNFGIFEGLTYGEIVKKHSKLYKSWIGNPIEVKVPGGEEMKQFCLRVRESFLVILSRHQNKSVAVITHGGPIRIVLCGALKYNMGMFWKIEQSIGALNILEYSEGLALRVNKINDTTHLLV